MFSFLQLWPISPDCSACCHCVSEIYWLNQGQCDIYVTLVYESNRNYRIASNKLFLHLSAYLALLYWYQWTKRCDQVLYRKSILGGAILSAFSFASFKNNDLVLLFSCNKLPQSSQGHIGAAYVQLMHKAYTKDGIFLPLQRSQKVFFYIRVLA